MRRFWEAGGALASAGFFSDPRLLLWLPLPYPLPYPFLLHPSSTLLTLFFNPPFNPLRPPPLLLRPPHTSPQPSSQPNSRTSSAPLLTPLLSPPHGPVRIGLQ